MKWLANMVRHLMEAARKATHPFEKMQEPKRQTRFTYKDGPMVFLGQQIVKAMQDAGYPAKIIYDYRSPELQESLYAKGRTTPGPGASELRPLGRTVTNARAYQSPHQFIEAVDIIHPSKGWNVSDDYWDTLHACAQIVEERFGVTFEHGYEWGWDKAHIELKDWRDVRDQIRDTVGPSGDMRPPTPRELWERFETVLPAQARQHRRSPAFQEPLA